MGYSTSLPHRIPKRKSYFAFGEIEPRALRNLKSTIGTVISRTICASVAQLWLMKGSIFQQELIVICYKLRICWWTSQQRKEALRRTLTQRWLQADEQQMLDGSIRLAARLLLMLNIGSLPSEVSGRLAVPWPQGSLQEAIHNHFNSLPEAIVDTKHEVIGSDLTCRNIERIAGIEIVPTDNLLDHLRLVDKDKKLCVFHHIAFLKRMKTMKCPMFPNGFVEETLDTLTLLLPDTDRKTKRWLEDEFKTHPHQTCMDRGLLRCGCFKTGHPSRRVERYRFWRDRLEALREAVEEATPPSKALLKALRDRKKGDRWLNSWVAILAIGLTLFFGLVQSIEGAIQVFKAYHPTTD